MKLSSAFAIAAITVVVLSGCQSTPQPKTVLVTAPPLLPPDRREAVWLPDRVAPYTAGRYVDPRDPNVVHEAHTIYRREQTSRANLAPPEFLVLPPVASPSATNGTALLRDALTAELNQQRATSKAIIQQAGEINGQLQQINTRTKEFNVALTEAARLRKELEDVTTRLNLIENSLRPAPVVPTNQPKRSLSDDFDLPRF